MNTLRSHVELRQAQRYGHFYGQLEALSRPFRFDVQYRVRRLPEVLDELGIARQRQRVLDFGFGGGELLRTFPTSCELFGVDVSRSAVRRASIDRRNLAYASSRFEVLDERDPTRLPEGPFDVVISSHTLEHVVDDRAVLAAMHQRMRPGATLALFVPIEEPDYVAFHLRSYCLQSITERVLQAGFDVRHVEGSMFVNGHIWKLLTIPSRRRWPLIAPITDAVRTLSLATLPYPLLRAADDTLYRLGFGARQALVIATRP